MQIDNTSRKVEIKGRHVGRKLYLCNSNNEGLAIRHLTWLFAICAFCVVLRYEIGKISSITKTANMAFPFCL